MKIEIEPFHKAARRAGYTCKLCALGPNREPNVRALYFVGFGDDDVAIAVCPRHAEALRTAATATDEFERAKAKVVADSDAIEQAVAAADEFERAKVPCAERSWWITCHECGEEYTLLCHTVCPGCSSWPKRKENVGTDESAKEKSDV